MEKIVLIDLAERPSPVRVIARNRTVIATLPLSTVRRSHETATYRCGAGADCIASFGAEHRHSIKQPAKGTEFGRRRARASREQERPCRRSARTNRQFGSDQSGDATAGF